MLKFTFPLIIRNPPFTITGSYIVSSYYSLSMCDRSRSRHGICKRKYYRSRGITGCNVRRRPGPLGQLLAFLFSTLATCTKKIVIAPSQYIVDNIIPTFFQRWGKKKKKKKKKRKKDNPYISLEGEN